MTRFTTVIVLCLIPALAAAQEIQEDSLKTYQSGEVVVTATRSSISEKDAPSPTEVLGTREIQNSNGATVADALQTQTGVLLREYGGAESLATASLRGSASEHVLILIDGNRITGFQNNLVDLSLLPLDNVSRIEVLYGGASALYGADAVGGVINILTRPIGTGLHVSANGSAGSYGFQRYAARAEGGSDGFGLIAGYSNERGTNDFPFSLQRPNASDTTLDRKDADYTRNELYFNGNFKIDEYSSLDFSIQNVNADRGAPGPIYSAGDVSLARENDKNVNGHLGYHDGRVTGTEFSLNAGYQYGFETYVDPVYLIDSYYKNLMVSANPQVQAILSTDDRIIIGGEFIQGILEGNDFGKRIQRTQTSGYFSNEYSVESIRPMFDRISLYQTLRYDHFSDVGHALTPKLGFNLRIFRTDDVRLRASYGQSYRAPSFNDLYYVPFNNTSLQPEHSQSYDVGLLGRGTFLGEHAVEATYFYANTKDRIVFDPVSFIPVNIGKTISQGIESSYRGEFLDGAVDLNLNYTYTDARKQNSASATDSTFGKLLVLIPQHQLKAALAYHFNSISINVFYLFTGARPVSDDNSTSLPKYALTSANVTGNVPLGPWKVTAKVEMDNIFDVNYQVYPAYPMPGRTYKVNIGVEY
jgi:vitamin B12 transporter